MKNHPAKQPPEQLQINHVKCKMVAFNPKELLDKKWPLLGLINGATCITLCTIFFYNAANCFAGDNDGNRGRWRNDEGEWDPDFKQEEREAFKIVLCLLILIVGCVSLIIPALSVWHPTKGSISMVPVGMLSALQFMFGQMLFISYWYLSDFEKQDEEEDNNNQDEDYDYQEMSEEERLAYYQKVTRNFLIVMALVQLITSVYLYEWGRKLSSSVASLTQEKTGQISVFKDVWKSASYLSLGILSLQTLIIFIWFFGERGERMREEGLIYNTFMVSLWALMLTGIALFAGYKSMVKKEWTDAIGVGALGGCYIGLGVTFFMVFVLYCFASLDDRMEQEMPISVSISVCAFFLFTLNIFLGCLTLKYSDSILADISENEGEANSDYYNMEKPSCNNEPSPRYTKKSLPDEQFSDSEYVRDFDEEIPAGVEC